MESQEQLVSVVIIDEQSYRLCRSLSEDPMLTIVSLASEDPACWEDMVVVWPRYRIPVVPEFIDGLAFETVDRTTAIESVTSDGAWVVIDLVRKRVVAGPLAPMAGRNQGLEVDDENSRRKRCSFGVHLPPWWEYQENATSEQAFCERTTSLDIPTCNRQVLYGEPLLEDLARRMLGEFAACSAKDPAVLENHRARHEMTVNVHRDWLMTPREDLHGRTPREQLHGAQDWLERLVNTQQARADEGNVLTALPNEFTNYATTPMGLPELVTYFDLCRELISAGWIWCRNVGVRLDKNMTNVPAEVHRRFVEFLRDIQTQWLQEPDEDGLSPNYIIECSRRRVPCGSEIDITGIETPVGEGHTGDCDCPICKMMAEHAFGPSFIIFDGHHLELDDEFAFSTHELREDWEMEQGLYGDMDDEEEESFDEDDIDDDLEADDLDAEDADEGRSDSRTLQSSDGQNAVDDEFAPVWSNPMSDGPLPGDPQGYLKFAFLLAEIISMLQSASIGREEIEQLNEHFTDFRRSSEDEIVRSGRRLSEVLEACAAKYPQLISRVADFQSKIDEHIRAAASDADCDSTR